MVAHYNSLPSQIKKHLMNIVEPEIMKHFTERRFRPLTLLAYDEDKIKKFDEMKELLASGEYSQIPFDF